MRATEDGDDDDKVAEAPEMEFSLNVGVQFGLDRRHLRHGTQIPRLARVLRAAVSQDEAVSAGRAEAAFFLP